MCTVGALLDAADLSGASLQSVDARGASFAGARMSKVILQRAHLDGASFAVRAVARWSSSSLAVPL